MRLNCTENKDVHGHLCSDHAADLHLKKKRKKENMLSGDAAQNIIEQGACICS